MAAKISNEAILKIIGAVVAFITTLLSVFRPEKSSQDS